MFKKILCVIPARSGSKGIPNKNIYILENFPLIAYTINYVKKSNIVMDIIVTTDSQKIKSISEYYGAEVPFLRPKELATDNTPDFPVCFHALTKCEEIYNKNYDYIVWARPTSPVRPPNLVNEGLKILETNSNVESVRSVSLSKQHPFRQFYIKNDKLLPVENTVDDAYNKPRQFLPNAYFQTGHLEIIRTNVIKNGNISGSIIAPLFVDNKYMFDLDTEKDMAQLKSEIKLDPSLLAKLNK